ncbi:MAG: hypothetical protein WKF75_06700 [Singulisphaera sp.]
MPFAVFRRHQRKMLAIFAILAMFGFVLADSLPRLFNSNSTADADPVVVQLKDRSVRSSEVAAMAAERSRASRFIAELNQLIGRRPISPAQIFGDVTTRPIVDALILKQYADALAMPADPQVAKEWLKLRTGGLVNADLFEEALRRSGVQVTGEQILSDIANQVRLANARQLLGEPIVTPLDVFQSYRDQNERVSVRAVPSRSKPMWPRSPSRRPSRSGRITRDTRTYPRIRLETPPASASLARFAPRSSRSMARPWPGRSRRSSPRPNSSLTTRIGSRSSRNRRESCRRTSSPTTRGCPTPPLVQLFSAASWARAGR